MEVSLVTGGNSGIGYEVVRQLAKEGIVVYLGSRDPAKGSAAAAELASAGDVRPIHLDLADEATLRSAVDQIKREQGRLDLLVNNAGIAPIADTLETIGIVFQTNLHGPVLLSQPCVPLLRKSAAGRVVNVSSAAGQFSFLAGDRLKMDSEKLYYAYPPFAVSNRTISSLVNRAAMPSHPTGSSGIRVCRDCFRFNHHPEVNARSAFVRIHTANRRCSHSRSGRGLSGALHLYRINGSGRHIPADQIYLSILPARECRHKWFQPPQGVSLSDPEGVIARTAGLPPAIFFSLAVPPQRSSALSPAS